jgi:S-adenosylmethionine:tRNA ribosyltransferase-isomerase
VSAKRVIAIGTTATRALESAATFGELSGRTRLFITPGYEWKIVDAMLTNFHMPRTSLLLMIGAFVGEAWKSLYQSAIEEKYRFLSFGDAMFLQRLRAD